MMRLSCVSMTGSPTIVAFFFLDFFIGRPACSANRSLLTGRPSRLSGVRLTDRRGTSARRQHSIFPSKNGVLRAHTELWPNIGGSRVLPDLLRHMKLLSIDVRFEYPV